MGLGTATGHHSRPATRDRLEDERAAPRRAAGCGRPLATHQSVRSAVRGNRLFTEPRAIVPLMTASAATGTDALPGKPERDVDFLRLATALLRDRLPTGWSVAEEARPDGGWARVDGVFNLAAPSGERLDLAIAISRSPTPRDVPRAVERALEQAEVFPRAVPQGFPTEPVIVARYLPPSTRKRIESAGAGYIDATGNIRITAARPALFLADRGTNRDPWRGPGRPLAGLRGEPAARIVRFLVDFAGSISVPGLARRAGTSIGATYRVVDFLVSEALASREPGGPITVMDWRNLLVRWSEDYGLAKTNVTSTYLEPRGLRHLSEELAQLSDTDFVVTGSLAAQAFAPYATPQVAMIYADDPSLLVDQLGLRSTAMGANVVIAAPAYGVVFERSVNAAGVPVAAPAQVAVDLLTGPGRNPAEADYLLDWMQANESAWRR